MGATALGRDTNFYYSFLVLPSAKRRAIVAVWDFCRAVDDAVDEPSGGTSVDETLAGWRAEIARCFDGRTPATPQGTALVPCIGQFGLPRRPFEELVDGVQMDVGTRRFETFDDLRVYCHHVASTVGLICVEIFGYRNPQAREYAVVLGLALQLTNILRDVPADLARGRMYLPLDELARFGCTEDDLAAGRVTPPVHALLEHQARRAHAFYEEARATLPREDRTPLVAAEIMAAIYRAILRKIEARGYDVFSGIVRVPRPRRALIAAGTWLRVMAGL